MQRSCEVCSGLEKIGAPRPREHRKTRRVLVGERIVVLCDAHAKALREHAVSDMNGAFELFREPQGKRSLIGRRSPLDRRIFPPRPEGRRRGDGRRQEDATD